LDKALTILGCFTRQQPVLSVGEIARMVGIHKSYSSRCLARLAQHGFVVADENRRYSLGLRLFILGSIVAPKVRLEEPARPVIDALARETNRTVQIGVRDGPYYVPVATGNVPDSMRYPLALGTRVPIYVSAAGKSILAFSDPDEHRWSIQASPSGELPRFGPNSLPNLAALADELAVIRGRGYSIAVQEMDEYQYSVAAPVFDHTGRPACAIVVFCVLGSASDAETVPQRVVAAAAELSGRLGAPPDALHSSLRHSRSRDAAAAARL
jgi:DNA-binding IclR family transcriptional regulator